MSIRTLTVVLLAVACATASRLSAGEGQGGGFGMGPGMILVEQVMPGGDEVGVILEGERTFEVFNDTTTEQTFAVLVRTAQTTISSWEVGYENIPDASWMRVEPSELKVPANSKGHVKLFVKIPDKPEHFNRKWMGVVAVTPGKAHTGGSSVGLMVASRVQIETVHRPESDPKDAGPLAMVPSMWMMSDARPGDSWRKAVKVRNNTEKKHTYTLKKLADLEKDESRHERYFGRGFMKVIKESWVQNDAGAEPFVLKPGEERTIRFMVSIPATATKGENYEELVFLQDETGMVNFIRLRTELEQQAAAVQVENPAQK